MRPAWVACVVAVVMTGAAFGAKPKGEAVAPTTISTGNAALDDIEHKYMEGQFEEAVTAIKEKTKELTGLNAAQAADLATIKQGLTECYPTWWKTIKTNHKKMVFKTAAFNHNLNCTYDPDITSSISLNLTAGQAYLTLNWPVGDIDSTEKAEHGFTKGDLANSNVWLVIGSGDAYGGVATAGANVEEMQKLPFARFVEFRGDVTSLYYATPRARRWVAFVGMISFEDKYKDQNTIGSRRALGAFVMTEVAGNPKKYPSLRLPLSVTGDNVEQELADHFSKLLEKGTLTLTEDKSLREAVKAFAGGNYIEAYKNSSVMLPNKLQMALDIDTDKALQAKRNAWYKQQVEKANAPAK